MDLIYFKRCTKALQDLSSMAETSNEVASPTSPNFQASLRPMLLTQDPAVGLKPLFLPDRLAQRKNDERAFECDSDYGDDDYTNSGSEASEEDQPGVVKGAYTTYVQRIILEIIFLHIEFYSWVALLFYVYTGSVTFAPLRSQGMHARRLDVNGRATLFAHQPHPCSPKSMHSLAEMVNF